MGFKVFRFASATITGVEVAHMIHKNQFAVSGLCGARSIIVSNDKADLTSTQLRTATSEIASF